MKLTIADRLGGGAYGDVYAATDDINRKVAVKIIRWDDPADKMALGHAKILAQASHSNIVRVWGIEEITDPADSSRRVTAVVMEFVEGQTLTNTLRAGPLHLEHARRIGRDLMSGLLHMVERDLAHGDLHTDNIMVSDASTKIIDILYLSHGSQLSTVTLAGRIKRDTLSARLILQELLQNVHEAPGLAKRFNDALELDASLKTMSETFDAITSRDGATTPAESLDFAMTLVVDPAFVAGDVYAEALFAEVPDSIATELLCEMIQRDAVRDPHRSLVQMAWARSDGPGRARIVKELSERLNSQVPTGSWVSHVRLVSLLPVDAWKLLPALCRIRLEGAIVKDVLNGYVDIYAPIRLKGGALGTWAAALYPRFSERESLVSNLAAMLGRNWYTQNYVGEYFLSSIPSIGTSEVHRKALIGALREALKNGAHTVQARVSGLPEDWRKAIGVIAAS